MTISRRTLLGAGLAAPLAAACGTTNPPTNSGAASLRKLTVLTGYGLLGQDAYLTTAAAKGFFAQAGIEIDLKGGAGTGNNLKLLAAGTVDVATVDLSGALQAYTAGNREFTTIAAVYQRTVSCLIAKADGTITRPADLAGKTIAYTPGGVNYTLFPTYAKLAGFDPAGIRWATSPPPQLRAQLAAGNVDAITETVIGKAGTEATLGGPVVVLPFSEVLTDLYGNVLTVSKKLARTERDLVRRFRQAALKGLAYAVDHPDEAGRLFHQQFPTYPAKVATAETQLMAPYITPTAGGQIGTLDPSRVARAIAILQGAQAIPHHVNPPDVVAFDLAGGD